jgi:hypothetical protein
MLAMCIVFEAPKVEMKEMVHHVKSYDERFGILSGGPYSWWISSGPPKEANDT